MAKEISNVIFDLALNKITSCTSCQVRTSADAVLVDLVTNSVTLDSGNFGSVAEKSGGGRQIQCLSSAASDMKAISVSSAGSAIRVAIGISSASSMVDYVVAELSSAVALAASDQINLGTFIVGFVDPT